MGEILVAEGYSAALIFLACKDKQRLKHQSGAVELEMGRYTSKDV